ncbi:hypothetical protein [Acanthopleuribacter pedis]|uniref:Uncharacterized protein n=1 Tax=Acanthopleuribacter pedis TaxID=442870 RepID=A0A8J7QB87_9BACT|nr:hypothetical protein [Acanthopleuribacter pedis]MBO1322942.1 hypothetical protein [Acanthopleuribacter pedis]
MPWREMDGVRPKAFNAQRINETTADLQSSYSRHSTPYRQIVGGIVDDINQRNRGVLTKIDIAELRDQMGHLLYFSIKHLPLPVPYDVEYLPLLKSHFRNPTVIVMRRIRRLLMAPHRRILTKLEEEQARERHLSFHNLDVSRRMRSGIEEMQRYQSMSKLTKSVSRKLDILTKALHVPAQFHAEFKVFLQMIDDPHHLRHQEAVKWVAGSPFQGNLKVLRKVIEDGLHLLDGKSNEIFDEMERLSGMSLNRNMDALEVHANWFALGASQKRGEDFVTLFSNEEQVERKLKRTTWFMVRAVWDADAFRGLIDSLFPSQRELQENLGKLAAIYFDIEEKIRTITRPDGEPNQAIDNDATLGTLSEKEAAEARAWLQTNKTQLQRLKLELFQILIDLKKKYPDLALPDAISAMVESEIGDQGDKPKDTTQPRLSILDLHQNFEQLQDRAQVSDGALLADWLALRKKILQRLAMFGDTLMHRQLRADCSDFGEYERKLLDFAAAESRLEELRMNCEEQLITCYRDMSYQGVEETVLQEALDLIMDRNLMQLKKLDYSVLDADHYADMVDRALQFAPEECMYQLDQLLHEMHSLPRQEQLIHALSDWESQLKKKEYEAKQAFIFENEQRLQKIVDDLRAELRERIEDVPVRPARLRFEIFSLSDCFAGNLRTLLRALLRSAPLVTSQQEGERLIDNIQSIESQVIEAQRLTRKGGESQDRLRELSRAGLLPKVIIEELKKDMVGNFDDLNTLLGEVNEGLKEVRQLQNRFGGHFETSQFKVTINIDDLERLKGIYSFVENITLMDVKRFGVVYQHKNQLMDDLYERAYNKAPEVPPNIVKQINRRAYKKYKDDKRVPMDLKIDMLRDVPEILESETELLVRTLNFVSMQQIREKALYKGILHMMSAVKKADRERLRVLRRIWMYYRKRLQQFKPRNFIKNYDTNVRCLITDVQELVGDRLEDLR